MNFKYEVSEDYKNGIWLRFDTNNRSRFILVNISEEQMQKIVNFLNEVLNV